MEEIGDIDLEVTLAKFELYVEGLTHNIMDTRVDDIPICFREIHHRDASSN